MKLTIDLTGSDNPVDDLDALADITDGLADLLEQANDVPGPRVAQALAMVAALMRSVTSELQRKRNGSGGAA